MKIVIRRKNYDYHGFFKKVHYTKTPEKFFLTSTNDPKESILFDCVEDANKFLLENRERVGMFNHFILMDDGSLKHIDGEPITYVI